MIISVTATKGGVGATTVAAAMGFTAPGHCTLVDLTGDLAAAIGRGHDHSVGVADWLTSDAPVERLDELVVEIEHGHSDLLPLGPRHEAGVSASADRWSLLGEWCARRSEAATVVVDPGPNLAAARGALGAVRRRELLVTRACYLALRQRGPTAVMPDGVVLIAEPGRALGHRDVERAVGGPVVATMRWDPSVARAIDTGLDASGIPRTMRRTGRAVWRALDGRDTRRWAA